MPRTPEPELMDEVEQVQAYAYADFEAVSYTHLTLPTKA